MVPPPDELPLLYGERWPIITHYSLALQITSDGRDPSGYFNGADCLTKILYSLTSLAGSPVLPVRGLQSALHHAIR